jgi:uncharacterized protein YcnI
VKRAALLAALLALVLPATASGHPEVSPAVSLSGRLQLYSLAVPTEKSGATTTTVAMTVPAGFGIDSFAPPPPGWRRQIEQSGSGDRAVVTKVIWSGGHTPTGEDSVFQFLAQPATAGTYTFQVQQTYADGSLVNWSGTETSATPASTLEAVKSLGGGGAGVSAVTIVALVVGVLGLLAGAGALARGSGGRPLV